MTRPDAVLDNDFRERFIREADLAATLTHPNIVTVYDRGEVDGQLWIASQYIQGTDAAQLLKDSYPDGMPPEMVSNIVTGIASALDFASSKGLLHRDVKPANILLSDPDDAGRRHVYLAYFGIARSLAEPNGLTATNMTVGTIAYSAPEQLLGEDVDDRADQYALAATTYHLLAGSQLYLSSNVAVIINHQLNSPPPNLGDARPELARLDPILRVALTKQANDRFRRCGDFAATLAEQIGPTAVIGPTDPTMSAKVGPSDPTIAAPAGSGASAASTRVPSQADRRPSRSRALIAAAAVAAVLISGAVIAWRPWQQPPAGEAGKSAPAATQTVATESGDSEAVSARPAAEAIKAAMPEVTELIDLNEATDGNHLLGRPNGYLAATVLVDSRTSCPSDGPGVACGAVVEQWPDAASARRRADYVQQVTAAVPITGNQWTVVKDNLLLRVTGRLGPSQEKAYEAAFNAAG